MKEWKNKDVVIGIVIIFILGIIALCLLFRRELRGGSNEAVKTPAAWDSVTEVLPEVEMDSPPSEDKDDSAGETLLSVEGMSNVQVETPESSKNEAPKKAVKLHTILGEEKYRSAVLVERKEEDGQLQELFEYWDSYKLDAVDELVHLERLQKISAELSGTNHYYYYGSVNRLGRPSGKGLAVYADNTYYCGEWKDGLRHGKGMWLQAVIYHDSNREMELGITEHSYNGQWSRDLPNGEGQEHFSYDYNILSAGVLKNGVCFANVIGNFKDGYYHGEMYVMTANEAGETKDWGGICNQGVWEIIMPGPTTDAVWEAYDKIGDDSQDYYYMFPEENKNYGIWGLKK